MIVFEFRLGPARHTFLGYRMGAVVCWSVFNNQHGGERHRADVYCLPVSVEQYSEHVQFLKKGGGSFSEIGLYTIWFTHLRVHSTHRYIAAMTVVSFRTFSPPQKESFTLFYHPPFPPLHSCCKQPPICLLCL